MTGEPEAAPPRSRRGLRRLFACSFGLLLGLLATEVVVRVSGVTAPPVTKIWLLSPAPQRLQYHCYPSDPQGRFGPLPATGAGWKALKMLEPPVEVPLSDLAATPFCVEYAFGSPGVRGPAIRTAPVPGVVRILGVGDSFAFGEGVPFEDTLFRRVEEALGTGYEVPNLAVSGADLEMEAGILDWGTQNYGARRAILVVIPNDVALAPALRTESQRVYDLINLREEHLTGDRPWYTRVSRTAALIESWSTRQEVTRATIQGYLDAFDPALNGPNLKAMERLFQRVAGVRDRQVAVVIFPLMIGLSDGYPLHAAHEPMAAMARAAGLPVLDLAPLFDGRDEIPLQVHPVDHHPNAEAHRMAGAEIARWLRDEVPGFLPTPR